MRWASPHPTGLRPSHPPRKGEGQQSSHPGRDGEDALRALHDGQQKARRCGRAFVYSGYYRLLYAASSATAASPSPSPSLSDSLSAPASASGLAPRRGLLASWASISFTASVSVTCCTTAISRDSRSSAAS